MDSSGSEHDWLQNGDPSKMRVKRKCLIREQMLVIPILLLNLVTLILPIMTFTSTDLWQVDMDGGQVCGETAKRGQIIFFRIVTIISLIEIISTNLLLLCTFVSSYFCCRSHHKMIYPFCWICHASLIACIILVAMMGLNWFFVTEEIGGNGIRNLCNPYGLLTILTAILSNGVQFASMWLMLCGYVRIYENRRFGDDCWWINCNCN